MMPLAQSKGSSPNWERQSLPGESEYSGMTTPRSTAHGCSGDGLMSVVNRRQCSWRNVPKQSFKTETRRGPRRFPPFNARAEVQLFD